MPVKFYPHNHTYESVDLFEKINWISVTTLIGKFKEPFDAEQKARNASLNKKSKWYGIHPTEIKEYWRNENKRSVELGVWYHDQKEKELLSSSSAQRFGNFLPVIKPLFENGIKIAPDQRLIEGIYPEHFVYLKSQGVCGQSDEVIVHDSYIHIEDHKSNKDLKKPAYVSWDKTVKTLLPPLNHVDDCKLSEYAIQLSTYMYIILKHNPQLKVGTLALNHVVFEEEDRDRFDYPIIKYDQESNPIVKSVERIPVPYLKNEVELMLKYKK